VLIAEKIRKGELAGLSMGKAALVSEKKGQQTIEEHEIFEVSVVKDPDLEGAWIKYKQPRKSKTPKVQDEGKNATPMTFQETQQPGFSFFSTTILLCGKNARPSRFPQV
jgi:hypothetical protein